MHMPQHIHVLAKGTTPSLPLAHAVLNGQRDAVAVSAMCGHKHTTAPEADAMRMKGLMEGRHRLHSEARKALFIAAYAEARQAQKQEEEAAVQAARSWRAPSRSPSAVMPSAVAAHVVSVAASAPVPAPSTCTAVCWV